MPAGTSLEGMPEDDRRTGQPPIAERTAASETESPAGRRITLIRA